MEPSSLAQEEGICHQGCDKTHSSNVMLSEGARPSRNTPALKKAAGCSKEFSPRGGAIKENSQVRFRRLGRCRVFSTLQGSWPRELPCSAQDDRDATLPEPCQLLQAVPVGQAVAGGLLEDLGGIALFIEMAGEA